jgi:hypothetical protein
MMLLEAGLKILLLFLPFMGARDVNIDDAVSTAGPQSTDKNIPSVFDSVFVKVVRNLEVWYFQVLL